MTENIIDTKLQIFLILISIGITIYILNLVRKQKLELKYSLVWITIGFILVLISLFPQVASLISNFLGIGLSVNTVFLISILLLYIMVISLTVVISKVSMALKRLTQEIAILRLEIDNLRKQQAVKQEKMNDLNDYPENSHTG